MSMPGVIVPKVLLIDDNPDDRFKIRWMLSRERDLMFYEAASAVEGQTIWQKVRPDLVLLDLSLPDGRGEEVMRIARENHWGDPIVVAVSGLSLPERVSELSDAGVSGFLAKDRLTQALLSSAIDQAFNRASQRQRTSLEQTQLDDAAIYLSQALQLAASQMSDLADPILESDTPPIRLLKGMFQRRGLELVELAQALKNYAQLEPIQEGGSTVLADLQQALAPILSDRVQWHSALDPQTVLAVGCTDLIDVLRPMVENAIRHDRQVDTQISLELLDVGQQVHVILNNLHPGLSALWQLDSDALFLLGRVVGERSSGRLGQGLAGVLKRLRGGPIQMAISLDPSAGFSLILKIPKGPRTH